MAITAVQDLSSQESPWLLRLLQQVLNWIFWHHPHSFHAPAKPTIKQQKTGCSTDYTKPHPHFSIHNMASIHYSEQRCTFAVLEMSLQHLTDGIHNLRFREDDTKTASLLPIRRPRPKDFRVTASAQIRLKRQHCILRKKKTIKKLLFKLFVPEMQKYHNEVKVGQF